MLEEMIEYAKMLNKEESLPSPWLRRNSIYYPLRSYINHTIAFLISEEYVNTALFIRRANKEIESLRAKECFEEKYFILCDKFLQMVSQYLLNNKLISEDYCDYFIPDKYRNKEI